MKNCICIFVVLVVTLLIGVACASSTPQIVPQAQSVAPAATPVPSVAAPAATPVPPVAAPASNILALTVSKTALGSIIADGDGKTLYTYTKDTKDTSACYDACATNWPPLLADKIDAKAGVDAKLIGYTKRTDGKMQVTYNGMPLYYFAKDVKPGDTTGQNVGGIWFVLATDGNAIKLPTAAPKAELSGFDAVIAQNNQKMFDDGRKIFRFDTFGDEVFWGDTLKLHQAIQGSKLGGVGNGVSPKTALSVGLKVDMDALPADLVAQIKAGKVDLDDPATTLALLKLNSVVGLTGFFTDDGKQLKSIGIQCALCHSTVDDAFATGIGHRLDGYPNSDLNVGVIVSLAPDKKAVTGLLGVDEATLNKVLTSWGPGKFDAEVFLDGKAFAPDGKSGATLIPAAFGLAGVSNHTWTGAWGDVTYWNAFVANLEMHGQGFFFDPRLDNKDQYPVAAKAQMGHKADAKDMITAKLPALQFYQLAIPAPKAPDGSFDKAAADRGQAIFTGKAKCAGCHVPPIYAEPGWNLHTAAEIGIDDFQAKRGPDQRYRTSSLRALWDTQRTHKGGFYHDGRYATLGDVVNHYNDFFNLNLTDAEKKDLIEFLKSL